MCDVPLLSQVSDLSFKPTYPSLSGRLCTWQLLGDDAGGEMREQGELQMINPFPYTVILNKKPR